MLEVGANAVHTLMVFRCGRCTTTVVTVPQHGSYPEPSGIVLAARYRTISARLLGFRAKASDMMQCYSSEADISVGTFVGMLFSINS